MAVDSAEPTTVRLLLARARADVVRFADRVRRRGRPAAVRAARLTIPAVIAYVVARLLFPHAQPLTGPLTALLVVQVSLFATLTTGLRRVLAVVSGVVLAVLLSSLVDLTWWSLGTVIAVSIVIGQVLRLGEHLLEVPISAMLVLGVTSAEQAAASRVAETLVGAAVGVLWSVLLPPSAQTRSAGEAVEVVALRTASVLDQVAEQLPAADSVEQTRAWLDEVRRLGRYVVRADAAIDEAGELRRLNPRAVGTTDRLPLLRQDLDALEHAAVALRQLFRAVTDTAGEAARQREARERGESAPVVRTVADDPDVREVLAELMRQLAQALRSFGALARAEGDAGAGAAGELALALESLGGTRALVTELLLVDPRADATQWQLHGALLGGLGRVLAELDLDERQRRRDQLQTSARRRSRASETVSRWRGARP